MPPGKLRLSYSAKARDDLWRIGSFVVYKGGDASSAQKMINDIQDDADKLAEFPDLGIQLNQRLLIETDYRMLVSGNHNVFYRRLFDDVIVVRVLPGVQDWQSLLFGKD